MIISITISGALPLQFGSYVQFAMQKRLDGVIEEDKIITFDANKLAVVYDNSNPNIVVFHFGDVQLTVSNWEYNEFIFVNIPKTSPLELAQAVITDVASYTT
jgi:hypothetical protein